MIVLESARLSGMDKFGSLVETMYISLQDAKCTSSKLNTVPPPGPPTLPVVCRGRNARLKVLSLFVRLAEGGVVFDRLQMKSTLYAMYVCITGP
jgi:hypothetical protein